MTDPIFKTIKDVARGAYIMGLIHIEEMVNHVYSHYDAYFLISDLKAEMERFDALVKDHLDKKVDDVLTLEERNAIEEQMSHELANEIAAGLTDDNPVSEFFPG